MSELSITSAEPIALSATSAFFTAFVFSCFEPIVLAPIANAVGTPQSATTSAT